MSSDLYSRDLSGGYVRACGGNTGDQSDPGTQDSCVEYAPITGGGYALRDTKNPDGPELRFSAEELDAFVQSYQGL
ncbi:DUF397 domain-containing protein [Phytomonospora endophytica]|uniref:DUF397 domain-containing protein n=1 Tax=Phytomonospora endophytica TaxID=714109 RepID=A0A841G5F7_9ACTN|nr:DUF397 domain-containing protein [Phytomonospora endophytica]MBB6039330.1 hypothetical protein [Phytomonospora endophytica]GIG69728.1 hypothetical protein Pen01_60230 [Phytomonospora endophytica]